MNSPPFNSKTSESSSRAGVARIVRRISLLREQGDTAEAETLSATELGNAVRDYRLKHGADALTENDLQAMHQREEQRIADALVLAEILIPQLVAARAPAIVSAPQLLREDSPRSHHAAPVVPFSPSPDLSSAAARGPASGSPAIPDLLDAMLAAERNGRRATANQRQ